MALSYDLLKQFASITNDSPSEKKEQVVYGTVKKTSAGTYVKFDGSELMTPVTTATDATDGDRVGVLIKNHSANLLYNFTSPSVSNANFGAYKTEVIEKFDAVYTTFITAEKAELEYAKISLVDAANGRIDTISGDLADYKTVVADELKAIHAKIGQLDVTDLTARVATIEKAYITTADVDTILAGKAYLTGADIQDLTAKVAEIDNAYITSATVNSLLSGYATIDLANIKQGCITTAMLGTGIVGTAQIADGSITDAKIVELTANKINAGTLSVERLEIRGSKNSLVYALNDITGALQAQNVNTLNGEILTPRSITADKIVANAITSNEIAAKTITANNIAANSITGNEIMANSITGTEIAANSIKATHIDVLDLFAQDITATGTIRGVTLEGATGNFSGSVTTSNIIASGGKIGCWTITATEVNNGEWGSGYGTGFGQRTGSAFSPTEMAFWAGNGKFRVNYDGSVYATSGSIAGFSITDHEFIKGSYDDEFYTSLSTGKFETMSGSNYILLDANTGLVSLSTGNVYFTMSTYGDLNMGGVPLLLDNGLGITSPGTWWLGGKTATNCIYKTEPLSASSYHPMMRIDTSGGNVWNIGGLGDSVGIYGYYAARTANGTDWSTVWNTSDGTLTHSKNFVAGGEIISTSANGLRITSGNYGFFIRNDSVNVYFMATAANNPWGSWSDSYSYMNLASGRFYFRKGVDVTGTLISSGNITAASASNTMQIAVRNNNNNACLNVTQNAGVWHNSYSGSSTGKWLIYINTSGTVTANTSDKRWKLDRGRLSEEEAVTILKETDIINFVYKEDIGKNDLEQSGVYAQDLRDLLIRHQYLNRGYIGLADIDDNGEGKISYDITLPEETHRYEIDYSKFVPVLWKGWQCHDTDISQIKAQISIIETREETVEYRLTQALERITEQGIKIARQEAELEYLRNQLQAIT